MLEQNRLEQSARIVHPIRLAVLSCLAYAHMGAFLPTMVVHLEDHLHFSHSSVSWIFAAHAMAAVISPFIVGQIADRWFSAERCLSACALAAGCLLWTWAALADPGWIFVVSLAYWLFSVACLTLCASICFAHLAHPAKQFGRVRVCGTIGWIVASLLFGYWLSNPVSLSALRSWLRPAAAHARIGDSYRLAGLLLFVLVAYAFTLPRTPPRRHADEPFAPRKALRLLKNRTFALFFLCHFGACLTFVFWIRCTPLFLKHLGIAEDRLPRYLAIQQTTEIVGLIGLQWILAMLGIRGTLFLGLFSMTSGLAILAAGLPLEVVIPALTLHGAFICCFLIPSQIYVNSQATGDIRASIQAMVTFSTGLGMLTGHLMVGRVREWTAESFPATFGVGVGLGVVLLIVLLAGFKPNPSPTRIHEIS